MWLGYNQKIIGLMILTIQLAASPQLDNQNATPQVQLGA